MQKINKECSEGRVWGPFSEPLVANLRISSLGVVPKKTAGEFRLINCLNYLQGESVNEAIPSDLCTVRYTSFDQAFGVVRCCGWAAELVKYDIKLAFCHLPFHPEDFELLGFSFRGSFTLTEHFV